MTAAARASLAIDLGTTFGYALLRADNRIEHGEECLSLKKGEGEGQRFLKFNRWLVETNQRHEIGKVYFEIVMGHAPNAVLAAHIYGGLRAVLLMFCDRHAIAYEGIGVSTIKKRFAGHGQATKEDMKRQCRDLGFKVTGGNEADAIGILHVGTDRCPLLTMSGATPKGPRAPKPQPTLAPGVNPF